MTYLENMESLVLHHPPVVLELPHYQLEIVARINVSRHDLVELTVEQDFSQQLDALALGDITFRSYQNVVVPLEEHVEVGADVLRYQRLMLGEQQAERVEGVGADFKRRLVDPAEEVPEDAAAGRGLAGVDFVVYVDRLAVGHRFVVEDDGRHGVPFESFLQDATAWAGALPAPVAVAKRDDELGLLVNDLSQSVGLRGCAAWTPPAEDVGDNSLGVFARLEG